MKKVIDCKLYDTETADLIHSWNNGYYGSDFKRCEEDLYRTKKGTYFLHGSGGPMSAYAESCGNGMCGGENIDVLTPDAAAQWLEQRDAVDELQKYFPDYIEEG